MSLCLLTNTQLAVNLFGAAIPPVNGWLALGIALLALANPCLLELALMTVVASVTIIVGYNLPLLDHRFEPDATRIDIDATAIYVVVGADLAVFLDRKKGF